MVKSLNLIKTINSQIQDLEYVRDMVFLVGVLGNKRASGVLMKFCVLIWVLIQVYSVCKNSSARYLYILFYMYIYTSTKH